MKTFRDLLEEGYTFADGALIDFPYYAIDFDSPLSDDGFGYDKDKKLITAMPCKPDVTIESIELKYQFSDAEIIGSMLYSDDHFKITHNGEEVKNISEEFILEYSDFAYDIKQEYPSWGIFKRATLTITGSNSAGDILTYQAYYIPSSYEDCCPVVYSGTIINCNEELFALDSVILMYGIFDIKSLKERIKSLIGVKN